MHHTVNMAYIISHAGAGLLAEYIYIFRMTYDCFMLSSEAVAAAVAAPNRRTNAMHTLFEQAEREKERERCSECFTCGIGAFCHQTTGPFWGPTCGWPAGRSYKHSTHSTLTRMRAYKVQITRHHPFRIWWCNGNIRCTQIRRSHYIL